MFALFYNGAHIVTANWPFIDMYSRSIDLPLHMVRMATANWQLAWGHAHTHTHTHLADSAHIVCIFVDFGAMTRISLHLPGDCRLSAVDCPCSASSQLLRLTVNPRAVPFTQQLVLAVSTYVKMCMGMPESESESESQPQPKLLLSLC